NFRDVTVVIEPSDYETVLNEMKSNNGATSLKTRFSLAKKVFNLTHQYDGAISQYLEKMEI
ncbi:MAG: IMP cyclohydrolase, partial [Deltaproteobacteria bacterium]|nr:IMP cyclohydrolase [Deltaproteobacteria bacterium]